MNARFKITTSFCLIGWLVAFLASPAFCGGDISGTQESGDSEFHRTLSVLSGKLRQNRDSICFWSGELLLHTVSPLAESQSEVVFYSDGFTGRESFLASFFEAGDQKRIPIGFSGRIAEDKRVAKFLKLDPNSESRFITIEYPKSESGGLTPAAFSPYGFFRILDQDADVLFGQLKSSYGKPWFRYKVTRDGTQVKIEFGNRTLDVDDTILVFDLAKAGNLISMHNPSPSGVCRIAIEYESFNGIWLPTRYQRENQDGDEKETTVITVDKMSVNDPVSNSKFEITTFFPVQPGDRVFDQRSRQHWMVDKDLQLVGHEAQLQSDTVVITEQTRQIAHSRFWIRYTIGLVTTLVLSLVFCFVFSRRQPSATGVPNWLLVVAPILACGIFVGGRAMVDASMNETNINESPFENPLCGHYCLTRACKSLGMELTVEDVQRHMPTLSSRGNSFSQISAVAKELGLESTLQDLDFTQRDELQTPCIVYLKDPDHFVLLDRSKVTNEVFATDGAPVRILLDSKELAERWGGKQLSLLRQSTKVGAHQSLPQVAFETLVEDVGWLPISQAETVVGEFRFQNLGQTPVKIAKVVEDCDCVKVQYTESNVLPGDTGFVRLTFAPLKRTSSTGSFEHSAHVAFEHATGKMIRLQLAGSLALPITSTATVANFGTLRLPPDAPMVRAETIIPVTIPGRKFANVSWAANSDVLSGLQLQLEPDPVMDNSGIVTVITSTPTKSLALENGQKSSLTLAADGQSLNLPVRMNVRPDIEVFPKKGVVSEEAVCTFWLFAKEDTAVEGMYLEDDNRIDHQATRLDSESCMGWRLEISPMQLTGQSQLVVSVGNGSTKNTRVLVPLMEELELSQ